MARIKEDEIVNLLFEQAITQDPILQSEDYHDQLKLALGRNYRRVMRELEIKPISKKL